MDLFKRNSRNGIKSDKSQKSKSSNNGKSWVVEHSESSSSLSSPAARSMENIKGRKRKQPSTSNVEGQELELCEGPPSCKRQDRRLSFTQSDTGSVASSVYPSSTDDLVNEIDPQSPFRDECEVGDVSRSPSGEHNSPLSSPSPSILSSVSSVSSHSPLENYHTQDYKLLNSLQKENTKTLGGRETSMQSPIVKSFDDYLSHHCLTPAENEVRMCPLPALSWANASDVWSLMCRKDEQAACFRDSSMLDSHPGLHLRMRAILLDWLIEVCEVYKLHRETYYLAVDYLDRYLSAQKRVQKTHLQLIGITCLFVAAKVEEIYPPKIGEFAYVTDGACREEDILQHEILLLQTLDWSISPVTPIGWLGVYMQLNVTNRTPKELPIVGPLKRNNNFEIESASKSSCVEHKKSRSHTQDIKKYFKNRCSNSIAKLNNQESAASSQNVSAHCDTFIYPQFSGMEFVQTAQLLDLCSLDVGIGNYPYSVLAAAAITHTFNREMALSFSGLEWSVVQPCAEWMEPFFRVVIEESQHLHLLEQNEQVLSKYGLGHICPNIITDDSHIIQTHTTSMAMFDRVSLLREQMSSKDFKNKQEASPATGLIYPDGLLTPPASSRKPFDEEEQENGKESEIFSGAVDNVL